MVFGNIFKTLCIQNVRAMKLIFSDNVHYPLCVTCQMSHIPFFCNSGVRCQVHTFFLWTKLLGQLVEVLLSTGPTQANFRGTWFIYGRNQSGCKKAFKKSGMFTLYSFGFLDHFHFFALIKITSQKRVISCMSCDSRY